MTPPAGVGRRSSGAPLLKAIAWSIAFLVLGWAFFLAILTMWALLAYGGVGAGFAALSRGAGSMTLLTGTAQLIAFGLATWIIGTRVLHLGPAALRWVPARLGLRGAAIGLALGAAAALLALGGSVALADSHWSRDAGSLTDWGTQVLKTSVVLAPAALSEEVMFRGLPLVLFAGVIGRGAALLVIAGVVFAGFHAMNPDVTPLGLGNIALAGIFLGFAFYAPGGIWTAFGAHLGWNAMLAALDAPVSGLPFQIPFIDYHAGQPAWLSGGRFGPEGGLLATGAITLALLVAARWSRSEVPWMGTR